MARIRSMKPEMRRDLHVATWKRDVRLAFSYLWGYLDDAGRGIDDLRLLKADLFPLDDDVTTKKLNEWLDVMSGPKADGSGEPTVCRYEVAGQQYLHATKWRHQKISHPTTSAVPPCPKHDGASPDRNVIGSGTSRDRIRTSSGNVPESLRPSRARADQGSKGAREQGSRDQGLSLVSTALHSPTATREDDSNPDGHDEHDGPPADELASLVAAVHQRRPTWNERGIRSAARKALIASHGHWPRAVAAVLGVARDSQSLVPQRVLEQGWWWQELTPDWTGTAQQLIDAFDRQESA